MYSLWVSVLASLPVDRQRGSRFFGDQTEDVWYALIGCWSGLTMGIIM